MKSAKERRDQMNWSERGEEGYTSTGRGERGEERMLLSVGRPDVSQFLVLYIIRCGAVLHPSNFIFHIAFLPSSQSHRIDFLT